MKKICGYFCGVWVFLFFIVILFGAGSGGSLSLSKINTKNLSAKVIEHKPTVEKYASKYGMSEYVSYLLAIMEVESKGEGVDPMQSSESINGLIGNITSIEHSIKQGVLHFKNVLEKSKANHTDVWSAVQAYNYGGGFLDEVVNENWSFEKAIAFSKRLSKGEKARYVNAISTSKGYDYRYNYGNMFYVFLVQQYVGREVKGEGQFIYPLDNPIMTSPYGGSRSLILQDGTHRQDIHNGVDFVNGDDNAPIYAVADGTVVFAGLNQNDGALAVVIKHEDNLYTMYYHLSSVRAELGQAIKRGEILGIIGTTGPSTGIHLHFSVSTGLFNGYVDPMPYLPKIKE